MAARTVFSFLLLLLALTPISAQNADAGELESAKHLLADRYANGERQELRDRSLDLELSLLSTTSTTTSTVSEFCAPVPATGDAANLLIPLDVSFSLVDFFGDGPSGADPAMGTDQHNDDDSAGTDLPFTFDLFGELQSHVFINNNGNLSFGSTNQDYVPDTLPTAKPVVAPFWADVDTGNPDCDRGQVWQRLSENTLVVTWDNVGHFEHRGDRLNTFQVAISDGTNPFMGLGNNVCFSFDEMDWTTGDSDGLDGFGNTPAIVGVDGGNGLDFLQIGSFNHSGTDQDGPFGAHDGVDWLIGEVFCFTTAGDGSGSGEGSATTTSTTTTTTFTVCGDGVLDAGEACDDGNTRDDDCCNSACELAAPGTACIPDRVPFGDLECFDFTCNDVGTCTTQKNQDPCDDGKYCTLDDTCQNGTCRGTARSCDDGVGCTSEICDDIRDRCLRIKVDSRCDDGSYCTGRETCDMINDCQPGTPIQCADSVGCTTDRCDDDARRCVFEPTHMLCADDSVCNGAEVCDVEQGCMSSEPLECADPHTCTSDTCDEDAGGCVFSPNDVSCNDGNVCNGAEVCDETGGCAPGTPLVCDDGDPCNGIETCDPQGGCRPGTPLVCNDGNSCNGTETCDEQRGCVEGEPLECSDGNVCNGEESCDAELGCITGEPLVCGDDNVCNGEESCDAELGCITGEPLRCDDGNLCNGKESCSAELGCLNGEPLVCGDENVCNGEESCNAELGCLDGEPLRCADANVCNGDEVCNAELGCLDGEPLRCDDGDVCNGDEFCNAELGCMDGKPLHCNDGDTCNGEESCNAELGCLDGEPLRCDDGDTCNGEESCNAELGCVDGPRRTCAEMDSFCSMGRCDAESGECIAVPVNEGVACGESTDCGISVCHSGICEAPNGSGGGTCEWTIVALADFDDTSQRVSASHAGQHRDRNEGPSFRAQPFSRITGDICAARGAMGLGSEVSGSVASRRNGDRAGLVFGSWTSVEHDIATAGTPVRVFGDRSIVPGTWVNEVQSGIVMDKHPLGVVDTTGRHDRVLACRDAARGIASWVERVQRLSVDGVIDELSVPRGETAVFELRPTDTTDGVAVFEIGALRLARSTQLILSRGSIDETDHPVPVVVKISGDFAIGPGASIKTDGTLSPEALLWVVEGRRCDTSFAASGVGSLLCPNARVEFGPMSRWSGAAYGAGVKVGVAAKIEGRPFAGL